MCSSWHDDVVRVIDIKQQALNTGCSKLKNISMSTFSVDKLLQKELE